MGEVRGERHIGHGTREEVGLRAWGRCCQAQLAPAPLALPAPQVLLLLDC